MPSPDPSNLHFAAFFASSAFLSARWIFPSKSDTLDLLKCEVCPGRQGSERESSGHPPCNAKRTSGRPNSAAKSDGGYALNPWPAVTNRNRARPLHERIPARTSEPEACHDGDIQARQQAHGNEPCLTRLWQKGEAPSPCRGWVRGVGDRNEPRVLARGSA